MRTHLRSKLYLNKAEGGKNLIKKIRIYCLRIKMLLGEFRNQWNSNDENSNIILCISAFPAVSLELACRRHLLKLNK